MFHLLLFYIFSPDKLIIAQTRKGSNSVITPDRVTILAICNFSDGLLSIYQVSFNSLLDFLDF